MHPNSFYKLQQRKEEGNFRSLAVNDFDCDFYSNDYLGLSRINSNFTISEYGSTGSRLISGNSKEAENCETFLANFFEAESALVFNSGYDANLGLFSSVATRHDTIIYDEFIHASIRDGISLSKAKSFSFKHNDYSDLEKKLLKASGSIFIAIESLYSMDGDFAPLQEIAEIASKHQAYLIVDEAHACGIFGKDGKGLCDEAAILDLIFARTITFGKAYGTHGAAILGSAQLKDYLINFARSFIYTTALPPHHYQLIEEAIQLSVNANLRENLFSVIKLYGKYTSENGQSFAPNSPIQTLKFENLSFLSIIEFELRKEKIGVKLIKSPSVSADNELIRICIHAFNTKSELKKLFSTISQLHK